MVIVQCKVCNKTFDSRGMGTHVKVLHNFNFNKFVKTVTVV